MLKRNTPGRWSELDKGEDDNDSTSAAVAVTRRSSTSTSAAHGHGHGRGDDDCDKDDCEEDEYDYIKSSSNNKTDSESLAQEYNGDMDMVDIPDAIRRQLSSNTRNRPQLGPKGVLADYKAHQEVVALEREVNKIHRQEVLVRMAKGAMRVDGVHEDSSGSSSSCNKMVGEISDDDDNDDEFMREYRSARLKEMRSQILMPTFRGCKSINSSTFGDEVDSEDPRVFVLVHMHDPSVPVSAKCNEYFEELSVRRNSWKFLMMRMEDAPVQIDKVALPIITIYKRGEIVQILAGITYEFLTDSFTVDDLEWLLDNTIHNYSN